MSGSRLSTKGQLVIPAQFRNALNLRPGDKVEIALEGSGLVLRRESKPGAKLKRGKFGRPVLVAAEGPRAMTTKGVIALLEELP
jgi:AbrB family looped-hinge helix DNA binding protein